MIEKKSKVTKGHLLALLTILVWGTTFISTKVLLAEFSPLVILFVRFLIGYFILILLSPHLFTGTTVKEEFTFLGAGVSGITLYYLLENFALTYTYASNVSVIVSIAPIFTTILLRIIGRKNERFRVSFLIGFFFAIIGISMISFNGAAMHLNPLGDLLALLSAFAWGVYSVFIDRINSFGYPVITTTRRIFFYGIILMIPAIFFMDFQIEFTKIIRPIYFLNFLYLGVFASALCFISWNYASKAIGALKTSIYIYAIPVVTVIASALILNEKITKFTVIGTCLTLIGLILSEQKTELQS